MRSIPLPVRPHREARAAGTRRSARAVVVGILALSTALAFTGCAPDDAGEAPTDAATTSPTPTPTPVDDLAVQPLPADPVLDYQLGGAYEPAEGVTVVVRDSGEQPVEGVYSICYVNGFQTQPDAGWPDSLLLHDASGELVADPDWPDETLLDISTSDNRQAIADRLAVTIEGCAASGFDAVEFDNLDSYTRSDGALRLGETMALARVLVAWAHQAGLAAAQKNTPELEARGRDDLGFDFAIAEECLRFEECAAYTAVYGGAVLDVEYVDDVAGDPDTDDMGAADAEAIAAFEQLCTLEGRPFGTVLRDRDLLPRGEKGYVERRC